MRKQIVLWLVDWQRAELLLVREDLKEARIALPHVERDAKSRLAKTTYFPHHSAMVTETTLGDIIRSEVPGSSAPAPINDRPVIYLDQNHWSTIAKATFAPSPAGDEHRAALELAIRAREGHVILPMSTAHMNETVKWRSEPKRYRHAITLLDLSRGWNMRYPISIRRLELRRSFASTFHQKELAQAGGEVFSLSPEILTEHRKTVGIDGFDYDSGQGSEPAKLVEMLTTLTANIATLIDPDHVPSPPVPRWTVAQQSFTLWLASEHRSREGKRAAIDAAFLADIQLELATEARLAGISPEQLDGWLIHGREHALTKMPGIQLFREVLVGKHSDPRTRWESNDLTDLMYLTFAAAYSDFVVCERSTASQIEQAQKRLGKKPNVFRTLNSLIIHIGQDAQGMV